MVKEQTLKLLKGAWTKNQTIKAVIKKIKKEVSAGKAFVDALENSLSEVSPAKLNSALMAGDQWQQVTTALL